MKKQGMGLGLALLTVLGLLVVAGVTYGALWFYRPFAPKPSPPPKPAATLEGRRIQDLDYLIENLTRLHPDIFFSVSRKTFNDTAAALERRAAKLSDADFAVSLMQLVALFGDGHTNVPYWEAGLHWFPVGLLAFPEGVYATAAAPWESEVLGLELLAIDGQSVDKVWSQVKRVYSADNEAALRDEVPDLMTVSEVLHYLGITASAQRATLTFDAGNGQRLEKTLVGLPLTSQIEFDHAVESPPISRARQDEPFWFDYLPEKRVLYFQYNACIEAARFKTFTKELIAAAEANPVERIVIDLRYNGGGASAQFNPFLKWLKRSHLNRPGGIVVLIGNGTYSSALWNAIDLNRKTQAVLLGEPTGGKPNHFGEVRTFTLPNSGLMVQYSTRRWNRFPELGDAPSLEPDILVHQGVETYLAGRDTVLERAFSWR